MSSASTKRWPGPATGRRAVVGSAGRALRIEREELFELMGQRPELLQQLFGALFRRSLAVESESTDTL